MNYRYRTLLFGILTILLLFAGYKSIRYFNEDNFYKGTGWLDHGRFPLIKPYEAINQNKEDGWMIALEGFSEGSDYIDITSIYEVEKISVQDGIISIYSPDPDGNYITDPNKKEYFWYILIPAKEIEKGFSDEDEFTAALAGYGIDNLKWEDPTHVAQRFYWTWCLDWIPACN